MSENLLIFSIFPLIIALIVAVYIMIGVYVYRDAGKRGMNKILWTLVALFAPSFLGIVIYLLVRNNSFSYGGICPGCQKTVQHDYTICPHCGYELMSNCENCGKQVSRNWKLCPWCRQELPHDIESSGPFDEPKSNKGLITLIIAVVAVLFVVSVGLMFVVPVINYGNVQMMSFESNSGSGFTQKYGYFTGTKSREINLSKGQTAEIKVDTVIEKGSLLVEIINPQGKVIQSISDSGQRTITISAEQDESYQITVIGRKTKGSYSIQWSLSSKE